MTWSLQSNAAGKTRILIHDHKCNPTAHILRTRKKKKKKEIENKKNPGEVIYHIV